MRPATREEEHAKVDAEISASMAAWANDPDRKYIDRIAAMVFGPYCHTLVDIKHDAMDGVGSEFSPDAVRQQLSALLADMAMEYIRHIVPVDDLDNQVALAQQMVIEISAGMTASINMNERHVNRVRALMGRAN